MILPDSTLIPERPKLRAVEPMWVEHMGQRFLYLRDPMRMTEGAIMLPEPVAPLLMFLDGRRDLQEIRAALGSRPGLSITDSELRSLIGHLDAALMIENGAFRDAYRQMLREFRQADCRPPAHSGGVYPEDAGDLQSAIEAWIADAAADAAADADRAARRTARPTGDLAGVLCPHIDYARGHATYAELWGRARADMLDIETVIVLGTDHNGSAGSLTLTRQSYSTPYGILPTDLAVVDALTESLGDDVFDEELHHAQEHSIELASVWIHHMLRGREPRFVPILCGSFYEFTHGNARPEDSPRLESAARILKEVTSDRRTMIVAAGDLAHLGPAFGGAAPLDSVAKAKVKAEDAVSIEAVCSGDADGFLDLSRAESDRRNICGLSPIYMMLRVLGDVSGISTGYDQCPADDSGGSIVSIAGALLYS